MGFDEAAKMGIGMQKQWISRMDNVVRLDHVLVTGEIVEYDEKFSNGLMFPGDPNGAASEIINCRCVMKGMVKSISPALAAHRATFSRDIGFDEWRNKRLTETSKSAIINKKFSEHNAKMKSGEQSLNIVRSSQNRHILGDGYIPGRSYIYGGLSEAQELVNRYAGTGTIERVARAGIREIVQANRPVGVSLNREDGIGTITDSFKIHYSKRGTHIVPFVRGE